jgi:hypothetical protein
MTVLDDEVKGQLSELAQGGFISECRELNQLMGGSVTDKYKLCESVMPLHFTGKRDSRCVFVELNPQPQGLKFENSGPVFRMTTCGAKVPPVITDKESYYKFCEDFGKYKLDNLRGVGRGYTNFERKQLDFLWGFETRCVDKNVRFSTDDAIRVRQNKLQLEIVPYASQSFSFDHFNAEYIKIRMRKIGGIIKAYDRDYVFISGGGDFSEELCGAVKWESFPIQGSKRLVNIGIGRGYGVKYCFIRSYKAQGFIGPKMQEYGKLCRERLDSL